MYYHLRPLMLLLITNLGRKMLFYSGREGDSVFYMDGVGMNEHPFFWTYDFAELSEDDELVINTASPLPHYLLEDEKIICIKGKGGLDDGEWYYPLQFNGSCDPINSGAYNHDICAWEIEKEGFYSIRVPGRWWINDAKIEKEECGIENILKDKKAGFTCWRDVEKKHAKMTEYEMAEKKKCEGGEYRCAPLGETGEAIEIRRYMKPFGCQQIYRVDKPEIGSLTANIIFFSRFGVTIVTGEPQDCWGRDFTEELLEPGARLRIDSDSICPVFPIIRTIKSVECDKEIGRDWQEPYLSESYWHCTFEPEEGAGTDKIDAQKDKEKEKDEGDETSLGSTKLRNDSHEVKLEE